MLIGYVSDERYVALADVLIEFRANGQTRAIVRSTPRGAVAASKRKGAAVGGSRALGRRCRRRTRLLSRRQCLEMILAQCLWKWRDFRAATSQCADQMFRKARIGGSG